MKVALIGATGNVGSRILKELVGRGHEVLALARSPEKIPPLTGVTAVRADANDVEGLAAAISGVDAVISSVRFMEAPTQGLIDAVRKADVKRYIVVGGAGGLEIAPGVRECDRPDFPAFVLPESLKGIAFLDELRQSDLDWTFLSPSRMFVLGERTGKFRLGGDKLLVDENGVSTISFEDYAVALVDELEAPSHLRQRFTVGY